jgi:hypothetical protein
MKKKKFDCVKMKHDIQQEIMAEFKGLSEEEKWAITEKQILADPVLGPIWKKARPVSLGDLDEDLTAEGSMAKDRRNSR